VHGGLHSQTRDFSHPDRKVETQGGDSHQPWVTTLTVQAVWLCDPDLRSSSLGRKRKEVSQVQWLTPVIPATREAESRRIEI
jgi:hypothetical protein